VGAKRVIWHVGFERNLRRRGPPSFEVRSEVPLSEEPPRLDYLLLRKLTPEGEPVDHRAQTLRRLWPLLPRVSVVEYKSPGHPYRSGQLDRLWGYVHIDTLPAEQVLSHYAPEQRLAGLDPEQRLAGLDRDHQALALPVEVLRLLPEAYLRSLSPQVEAEIRRRLRQD
jgi:hypothetical protein